MTAVVAWFLHDETREIECGELLLIVLLAAFSRFLGPQRDEELLRYYSNRTVWLFEPDKEPPGITPYPRACGTR